MVSRERGHNHKRTFFISSKDIIPISKVNINVLWFNKIHYPSKGQYTNGIYPKLKTVDVPSFLKNTKTQPIRKCALPPHRAFTNLARHLILLRLTMFLRANSIRIKFYQIITHLPINLTSILNFNYVSQYLSIFGASKSDMLYHNASHH